MKISIFGLGYVGIVNLACLSKLGHTIYGCDIKSQKVDAVLKQKSYVFEEGVEELIKEGFERNLIHATSDVSEVVVNTDMALICVGTPSREDGTVNLDYSINTTIELAKNIKKHKKKYTIIYRSTVPPGTIEKYFIEELKSYLGNMFENVKVAFLPEFLREGSAVKDFFNCSRIVIGISNSSVEDIEEVFGFSKDIPLVYTDIKTAEFIKYVDNAFHAAKITFANEVYHIGAAYGINVQRANEIFLMDKHLNISNHYLRPGLPFGGSCLPKDMRAINHLAKEKNINSPLIASIMASNSEMQKKLYEKATSFNKKKILLIGLSFKNHTDDVRESPMLYLANTMVDNEYDLKIYDPDLNITTLRIENAWIVKYIMEDIETAIRNSELIIVCKRFMDEVLKYAKSDKNLILNCFNQNTYKTDVPMYYLYK